MNEEKKILLSRINGKIHKKIGELLEKLPSVHTVDDGIIIRFFGDWDNCDDNDKIKFKKIPNLDVPEEVVIFFYLPKGAYFDLKKREYIGCITCLDGKLELNFQDKIQILNGFNKICLDSDIFEGKALENTYIVTTNKP
jgi:hypothetical protein